MFCSYSTYTLFLQLLCFAGNTIEIMFSAKHNFCVSQIAKAPLRHPFQQPPVWKDGCVFWKLPKLTVVDVFVVFFVFWKLPKSRKWPEQLCAPKICVFRDHQEQIVLSYSRKTFLTKPPFSPSPKNHMFLGFFWFLQFLFHFSVWPPTP